ncbi:MAG: peptide/nickel transport system substrate-binding protein [Sphingomonadales bacterium]|jgi:peptide/nickel transport system substrate-binding protein|nr:peptide/nickel transport system substrate-binding protein [Sphingomonadales bacterium]
MRTHALLLAALAAGLMLLPGCRREASGPVAVSAIGGPPLMADPNRVPLDTPSAFLLESVAEGLVRFDATGDVVPGLAQSWIVSNDGLRYTFRLARADWPGGGGRITAEQVVARLKAAAAPGSRNPLKPSLGAIDEIDVMTDEVLEISLKSPRPNFLQLLAQPELALIRADRGAGPYRIVRPEGGGLLLAPPPPDEEAPPAATDPPVLLRGEPAATAAARFDLGLADLVLGGTIGDLPLASATGPAARSLVFDPVGGLFGLAFTGGEGPLAGPEARQALAMAIDRDALAAAFPAARMQVRASLLPAGIEGISAPAAPAWTSLPLAQRRALAARTLAGAGGRLRVGVALPDGPGYRLLFALLRRDWAAVGVQAVRAAPDQPADLRLIDEVAPASLASWYLRHFACEASRICDPAADAALEAARTAPTQDARRAFLIQADGTLAAAAPFIPLAAPLRWSLVSPRLVGFRPNIFGRHPAGELLRGQQ